MRSKLFWPSSSSSSTSSFGGNGVSSSSSSRRPKKNWEQYTRKDPPAPLIVAPLSNATSVSYESTSGGGGGSSSSKFRDAPDTIMEWGFDPWASSPTSVAERGVGVEQDYSPHLNFLFQNNKQGGGSPRTGVPAFYESFTPLGSSRTNPHMRSSKASSNSKNISQSEKDSKLHRNVNTIRKSRSPSNDRRNANAKIQQNSNDLKSHRMSAHMRSLSPPERSSWNLSGNNNKGSSPPTTNLTMNETSRPILPVVSQMTLRQILSIVFSAFWDRADLYTDVLALCDDSPTPRQLTLAFLRQGRLVLATPIESPDDMTFLTAGGAGAGVLGGSGVAEIRKGARNQGLIGGQGSDGMSTISVVRAGTPVSRKAKLKFQAISLAYELLRDQDKRRAYDEWRKWNSRLPPPVEEDWNHEGHVDSSNIDMDDHHSALQGKISTHSFQAKKNANVMPILRNSNVPSKWRSKKYDNDASISTTKPYDPIQKQKMIRWNEEVEELTITEHLPPYDPLIDTNLNKDTINTINYQYLSDPYGDSAEEWVGAVDHQLPQYNRFQAYRKSNFVDNVRETTNAKPAFAVQEANIDMDLYEQKSSSSFSRSRQLVRDFQSHRSTILEAKDLHQNRPTGHCAMGGYDPDDSLMVILDGPDSAAFAQLQNKNDSMHSSAMKKPWNRVVQGNQPEKEMTSCMDGDLRTSSTPKIQSVPIQGHSAVVQMNSLSRSNTFDNYGVHRNDKKQSETTITSQSYASYGNSVPSTDISASLGSATYSTDYGNDCDVGRTFDLAKGFQASLSNYINAAVQDMKEGLKVMGKHWDELKLMGSSGEHKNFFFLDAGELDAMMGILKEEMESIPNPFAAATACNPIPSQAPAEQKSATKGLFGNLFSKT